MSLFLIDPAIDMSIELIVSEPIERALAIQWERLKLGSERDAFCARMSTQLENVIPESIDWDIKEPTAPQLSYAMLISRQLGIAPPPEAMAYRGHMVQFIEEYAPILKERSKAGRKKPEND